MLHHVETANQLVGEGLVEEVGQKELNTILIDVLGKGVGVGGDLVAEEMDAGGKPIPQTDEHPPGPTTHLADL
jgi:hypothetical protein